MDEKSKDEIKEFAATCTNRGVQVLTVVGQIEGHYTLSEQTKTTKYEHILPALVAIEESEDIKGLLVLLNTIGGDVEAGLAMSEMIASMDTPTVSLVLGGGHSIGVPLAVSAKKSFIVPSATMTLHPVRTNGLVIGVPKSFEYFNKMQDRVSDFIARNSKISAVALKKLMMNSSELVADVGSIVDGKMAVKIGLIDEIGGLKEALSALYKMIDVEKDDGK